MSPNAQVSALLFSFLFSFVLILYAFIAPRMTNIPLTVAVKNSNGVLQPYRQLGWWKWMYRLSPFSYIIEGLLGTGKCIHSLSVFRYSASYQSSDTRRSTARTWNSFN